MRSPSGLFGTGRPAVIVAVAAVLFGALVDVTAAAPQTDGKGAGASSYPIPGHKPAPPAPAARREASDTPAVPPPPDLTDLPVPAAPAPFNLSAPTQPGAAPDLGATPVPAPPPEAGRTAALPSQPPTGAGLPGLPGAGNPPGYAPPPDPGPAPGSPASLPRGQEFRLVFEPGSDALPPADQDLLTGIAAHLAADQTARLELRAYASGTPETERQARRLSLARALAVRDYLVEQGVRSTRMDVRALGANAPEAPADRVDLSLVN